MAKTESYVYKANVIFTPETKREKELVKKHGKEWITLRVGIPQCFNKEPGYLIQSLDGQHRRWVEINKVGLING